MLIVALLSSFGEYDDITRQFLYFGCFGSVVSSALYALAKRSDELQKSYEQLRDQIDDHIYKKDKK